METEEVYFTIMMISLVGNIIQRMTYKQVVFWRDHWKRENESTTRLAEAHQQNYWDLEKDKE